MGEGRRYMAGDIIRIGLVLEHVANLSRVFVAFSLERDPLTESYFEATHFPAEANEWTADNAKRSRVSLEAPVPPDRTGCIQDQPRQHVLRRGQALAFARGAPGGHPGFEL